MSPQRVNNIEVTSEDIYLYLKGAVHEQAHLISHRRFQASTGGGAPDSPTGAAVKQPAASALAIGAGFAQQQQQLSTRAGFKQQHIISTRAGFWVLAAKHRAASAFLLRRASVFS